MFHRLGGLACGILQLSIALGCTHQRPPGTGSAPPIPDTTVVAADTVGVTPTDTTMGQAPSPTDTLAVIQDTTGYSGVDSSYAPTSDAPSDTTSAPDAGEIEERREPPPPLQPK